MLRDRLRLSAPVRSVQLIDREQGSTLDAVIRTQREAAFQAGVQAGLQQALESSAARLDQAVEHMTSQHAEASAALNRTAVELALGIARSIIRREQLAGNYDMETIVREALHASGTGRNPCTVHLNPVDFEELKQLQWRNGTHLEADEGVAQGDVQVETGMGLLVRDTRTALDSIYRSLQEEAA